MASITSSTRGGSGSGESASATTVTSSSPNAIILPLALAQFLCSYDTSSMNVAISDIAHDLDTTVTAVQTAISLFTLTMAALMITGSKLTDIYGRKRIFIIGVWIYALGAGLTAISPRIGVMILGWSFLEGIGTALLIPPVYILLTVAFDDVKSRARAFGIISAMAGLGAAAGPLIGGTITTAFTWRVSFAAEVVLMMIIWQLARRRIQDVPLTGPRTKLDILGAVLSAAGLALIVVGILQANTYGFTDARQDFEVFGWVLIPEGGISPVWLFVGLGFILLALFGFHIWNTERRGNQPLIHIRLFRNVTSNLGLVTQLAQWFMIVGGTFTISLFLQVTKEYSAIKTGLVLTPGTIGILLSSVAAPRLARRFRQKTLIVTGFVLAIAGYVFLLFVVDANSGPWAFAPGLFITGVGIGIMLTASVNTVQSSVPDADQGEISGVSRSASNLGSSLGVAIAGAILVAGIIAGVTSRTADSTVLSDPEKQQISAALENEVTALSDTQVRTALEGQPAEVVEEVTRINAESRNRALGLALASIIAIGVVGLAAAISLPRQAGESAAAEPAPAAT